MPRKSGWTVYILRCGDGSLYTGCTNDLERRLRRHREGKGAAYTRSRRPLSLVFRMAAEGRGDALRREAAIKQLSRSRKLELLGRSRLRLRNETRPRATYSP
ncbi:MAG: GIY-YIG nuclease family protein [Myxococcales bacterium]|nr:GIY-YIG nuclease family protein [Myxococcales bacterium]